jgi:Tryptophan-associated transmembrane protein (Trp_oprn_chp)
VRSRERLLCVLGILAGAGLALLAAGRAWVTQDVEEVPGVHTLTATGDQAASAVPALALSAAAGALVLLIAGPLAARLAGVVVTLAGGGLAAAAVAVLADPRSAAAAAVPGVTGRAGPLADPAAASTWVWITVIAGLLVATGGGLAAARSSAWSAPGRRFEQASTGGRAGRRRGTDDGVGAENAVRAWDALSRGDDPTA